jgi:outer membrane lipoprotein-sorting protein
MSQNNLTDDDLLQLILGELDDDRQPAVRKAMAENAELAAAARAMATAVAAVRAENAGRLSDDFNDRLRRRLSDSAEERVSPLRRMAMDRRWQLSAGAMAALAAVLAFLLLWGGSVVPPVSAMERMVETVRKAKSYKYASHVKSSLAAKPGGPRETTETTATMYWLAPDSLRLDFTVAGDKWRGPGPEMSNVCPGADKWALRIDNSARTFRRLPPMGRREFSALHRLDELGKLSGSAERELGTKKINGKDAIGFVVDAKKIDPHSPPGTVEIWIDRQTSLPMAMRGVSETQNGVIIEAVSDIQWNIGLDPKLFDLTPPPGYTDVTPKDVVGDLLKALGGPDSDYRSIAACSLGKIASPTEPVIAGLRKALSDSDKGVRAMAAWSLGQMGTAAKIALPDLQKALNDADPNVRSAAASAREKIEHRGK